MLFDNFLQRSYNTIDFLAAIIFPERNTNCSFRKPIIQSDCLKNM